MNNKKKNGVVIYLVLVSAVLFTKVLGLLRGVLLSQNYGTGIEASAFTAVSNLPLILFDVTFGTAISSAFVPVFNEKLSKDGNREANKFASVFLNIVLAFSFVLVVLGIIFPKYAVMLVASGFGGKTEVMNLASSLMRIIMPIMSFACCTFIFIGILQSYEEFIAPALVSLFSNLSMILYFLFLNKNFGIKGLAVAFVFGWALQFVFLLPFLRKKKFNYSFAFDLKSPDIKKVAILTLPLFVAALAQPINQLISSNLSSSVSDNGVATVNYAYTAYYIVAGVFSYALTNMFFPEMSRKFAQNDIEGATHICRDMLSSITAIIIPIMSFMSFCPYPIIKLLYQRGEFTPQDTATVSGLLSIYAVGMLFLSWQDIFNKYFYSMQKSVIPMICSAVGIVCNLVFSIFLTSRFGLYGLAFSTVLAGAVMTVCLAAFSFKVTKNIFTKEFIFELLKLVVSGIFALAICLVVVNYIKLGETFLLEVLSLVLIFVVNVIAYLFFLFILKSQNILKIICLFKKERGE